jgi:hypothetical protein
MEDIPPDMLRHRALRLRCSGGSWNRHKSNGRNILLAQNTPPPGEHWTIATQLAPRNHRTLIENGMSIADRHVELVAASCLRNLSMIYDVVIAMIPCDT